MKSPEKDSPTLKNPRPKRVPMGSDFGSYLKSLRVHNQIPIQQLATVLSLAVKTVENIELGYNPPPNQTRLKLWLKAIGESDRYQEACQFLRSLKATRQVRYIARHPANEHIDRLLDAYENGRLSASDLRLLQMIAPWEYS